jgi:hypothetical protein
VFWNSDSGADLIPRVKSALIVIPDRTSKLVNDFPVPQTLVPGQVVIRHYATGLNHIDWKMSLHHVAARAALAHRPREGERDRDFFGGCSSSDPGSDCGTQGCGGGCSIQGCDQTCGVACSSDQHHAPPDGSGGDPTALPIDYDGPDGTNSGDWNP